jgi:hypothetical protein
MLSVKLIRLTELSIRVSNFSLVETVVHFCVLSSLEDNYKPIIFNEAYYATP